MLVDICWWCAPVQSTKCHYIPAPVHAPTSNVMPKRLGTMGVEKFVQIPHGASPGRRLNGGQRGCSDGKDWRYVAYQRSL